jgi:UDPglucose 6-dehydrogenase
LENVSLLLYAGANIFAYDPIGIGNFQKTFAQGRHGEGNITYARSPEEALEDANVCFIFTEWNEFKSLLPEDYKKT